MSTLFTRDEIRRTAKAEAQGGVVVCGGFIGMKPATQHAINPRDPGGRAL